jgi:hypothetical protein
MRPGKAAAFAVGGERQAGPALQAPEKKSVATCYTLHADPSASIATKRTRNWRLAAARCTFEGSGSARPWKTGAGPSISNNAHSRRLDMFDKFTKPTRNWPPGGSLLLMLAVLAAFPCRAENFQRGQELYEDHCQACHEELMHAQRRKVKTPEELRKRIEAWAAHAGADWKQSEVDDVLYFLNRSFYRFDQGKM